MSIEQAKSFLKTIKESVVYASIGKVGAWNEADQVIPGEVDSPNALVKDFNDAIFFTKTLPNHYSLAALRHDWKDGTIYTQWNPDDFELKSKEFYCINDTGYVYKCISNNGDSPSTVMPDAVTPEKFETSDGYIWKLVALVPEPVAIMFNNAAYIPVKTLTESSPEYLPQFLSQSAAIGGTIDRIDVIQRGIKYSDQTTVTIVGDGVGAMAVPNIHAITGELLSVSVTNQGIGYTQTIVNVVDPSNIGGSGAICKAILSPKNGHGSDPESELFATNIIGSIQIQGTENGFLEGDFDYRKVCLHYNMPSAVDNPMYENTVKLDISSLSGDFSHGETIRFDNGGTAVVTFIGQNYIKVSSTNVIEVGKISGDLSAANAIVDSITDNRLSIAGDVFYRHYFDKRTKTTSEDIKITPIFKF